MYKIILGLVNKGYVVMHVTGFCVYSIAIVA